MKLQNFLTGYITKVHTDSSWHCDRHEIEGRMFLFEPSEWSKPNEDGIYKRSGGNVVWLVPGARHSEGEQSYMYPIDFKVFTGDEDE